MFAGELQCGFDALLCEFFLDDDLKAQHDEEPSEQPLLEQQVHSMPVQQQSSWLLGIGDSFFYSHLQIFCSVALSNQTCVLELS